MFLNVYYFTSLWIIVNCSLGDTANPNNTQNAIYYDWKDVIEGVVDDLEKIISDIIGDIGKTIPNITLSPENITIYFYTNCSVNVATITTKLSDTTLLNLFFDPEKESVFIIHGWLSDHSSDVNTLVKNAILSNYDVNVFVVEWPAKTLDYFMAFGSITMVGNYLAEYINSLHKIFNYPLSHIRLIGHSLGAHVCGIIGKNTNGSIKSIVGLDPAAPGFSKNITFNRLTETDANVVQVIHTSMKFLGINFTVGTADFFPNDGYLQPICNTTEDLIGSCSHSMSYKYYSESISDELFVGVPCQSYQQFKSCNCSANKPAFMGGFYLDERANGKYYLDIDN